MAKKSNVEPFRYLEIEKLDGGLKLSLNDAGKEEVKDIKENHPDWNDEMIMSELFDDVRGNSEYIYHHNLGEIGLGMTSADGITDGYYYDDDGNFTDEGHSDAKVYWFEPYQIKSSLSVMLRDGSVIFQEARKMAEGGEIWFKKAVEEKSPSHLGGWKKELPAEKRRKLAVASRRKNWSRDKKYLSAGRALQALANVTKDKSTKEAAKADADYFFGKMCEGGTMQEGGSTKIYREIPELKDKKISAVYDVDNSKLTVNVDGKETVINVEVAEDFWHGMEIDGNEYDINLWMHEYPEDVPFHTTFKAAIYPVIDAQTITSQIHSIDDLKVINYEKTARVYGTFEEGMEYGDGGGMGEYTMTVEFEPENKKAVVKIIEDDLQVSISDESMFVVAKDRIDIFGLTSKEENILFPKLQKSPKVKNIISQEMMAQGGEIISGKSIAFDELKKKLEPLNDGSTHFYYNKTNKVGGKPSWILVRIGGISADEIDLWHTEKNKLYSLKRFQFDNYSDPFLKLCEGGEMAQGGGLGTYNVKTGYVDLSLKQRSTLLKKYYAYTEGKKTAQEAYEDMKPYFDEANMRKEMTIGEYEVHGAGFEYLPEIHAHKDDKYLDYYYVVFKDGIAVLIVKALIPDALFYQMNMKLGTPRNPEVIFEVMAQGGVVGEPDVTENFYRFRLKSPSGVTTCAVPEWGMNVAESVKMGAKITTCKKRGKWFVQNIMIPTKKVTAVEAKKYAQEIFDKIGKHKMEEGGAVEQLESYVKECFSKGNDMVCMEDLMVRGFLPDMHRISGNVYHVGDFELFKPNYLSNLYKIEKIS